MTRCIHNEADLNYSNSSQNTAIHKFPRWTDRRNKKIKRSIRWFKKSSTIPILLTAIHKFPRSTERRTEKPRNDKKHSQRRNRPRLFQFSSKTPILQISIRIRRWKGKKREGKTARNANGSELITRWSGVIPRWIAESSNVPVAVTCGQASA